MITETTTTKMASYCVLKTRVHSINGLAIRQAVYIIASNKTNFSALKVKKNG